MCIYVYMYVCMYDIRHDIQIPCTRYVAINRLYLYLIFIFIFIFKRLPLFNLPWQTSLENVTICVHISRKSFMIG